MTKGLFFYFCASIAFIFSHNISSLIIIRFLQGISSAMILPVAQAYAAEISPVGKEGEIMGYINIAMYTGLSAGPMFGGVIKDTFGIQSSFGSMGIVCFLGFLLCIFFLPNPELEKKAISRTRPIPVLTILSDLNVAGVFIIRFGYILCIGALWSFLPLVAETQYHLSSSAIGIMMSMVVLKTAWKTSMLFG